MAWTSVSPHGISAAEGLDDVPAMSAAGNTLFAAGYDTGSERAAELWAASIGDEHWRLVHRISGMRRPESMAVHGGTGESGTVYVGGTGLDNSALLVRFHKIHGVQSLALPIRGGRTVTSLLTIGSYLFAAIDRGDADAVDATIWRTSRPSDSGAWLRIGSEVSVGRAHVHSIKLARGGSNEVLAGTSRATPGGTGVPGTGAEVWLGTDNGSRWERIATDGFGDADTGAITAIQSFRGFWGSSHMYAGTLNHRAGSTVYKHYPGNRWSAIPYDPEGAPIRSTATFEGRLFIGEGNNAKGAKLFYTINGDGWTQDGAFARPYDFSGVGGEVPLAFHALTPVYVSTARGRQGFLYVAVQYVGAGVKIWRRTLDLWDSVMSSLVGASDVGLPLTSRWRI